MKNYEIIYVPLEETSIQEALTLVRILAKSGYPCIMMSNEGAKDVCIKFDRNKVRTSDDKSILPGDVITEFAYPDSPDVKHYVASWPDCKHIVSETGQYYSRGHK